METLSTQQKIVPFCSAVIVAGGSSVRFGADKLFTPVTGRPALSRTLEAFAACRYISEIILVVRPAVLDKARMLATEWGGGKLKAVIPGGSTRAESSWRGVSAVSPEAELIAIHDGARPLVTEPVIFDAVRCAWEHGAAAPAIPVKDTIKESEGGFVTNTPERSRLFAVQTPQVFSASLIQNALSYAVENRLPLTDDCSAVEALGQKVFLSQGSEENIKITTPLDIELAEGILRRRML